MNVFSVSYFLKINSFIETYVSLKKNALSYIISERNFSLYLQEVWKRSDFLIKLQIKKSS